MLDEFVTLSFTSLYGVVEVGASLDHGNGPSDLANGDHRKPNRDYARSAQACLPARKEDGCEDAFRDSCGMGHVVRTAILR